MCNKIVCTKKTNNDLSLLGQSIMFNCDCLVIVGRRMCRITGGRGLNVQHYENKIYRNLILLYNLIYCIIGK